ncbi:enoyl-CoA hydratase/isomerase family protein [Nocardioides cavernaquae]|uniref:Enoyl-CoA hydratase/isomerase family protein n=1 Tax=Nocardioides cavernaquae TaxID=2321396 RepID=A0A3A5H7N0_9ACTN|nr:enoyl-CoA hydratase/isomerase family protein [Nocardioides cavernaquae]RJS46673.1 enoyl-CoA hydratase/isomerase family protein [Nocardioides cavernaquae]
MSSEHPDLVIENPAHLRVDRPSPGVVLITLDNPTQRNAMSDEMTRSWVAAVEELKGDESVRCVVVTGAGSAFSSGGNVSWLAGHGESTVPALRDGMLAFYRAWLTIRELEVPTIAAINGHAIGAGLCIAMACDLRFASSAAKLGAPFVKLGIHPGMASTFLFPDVVGEAIARDLLLTGRLVEGEEAQRLGLVSRVLPPEELLATALAAAAEIAATAPLASRFTKVALQRRHASIEDCLQWEAMAQPVTLATEDLQEGIQAVLEKRDPRFSGR